jgi:glutamine synthetase
MFHEDGRPYDGDPRQALARVVERYAAHGLTPVVATELEFYLIDDRGRELRVPPSPRRASGATRPRSSHCASSTPGTPSSRGSTSACEAMDIPADTTISEAGPGQFEINLMHQPDALKAADDAWFFKLLVGARARARGGGELHGQTLRGLRRQRAACAFLDPRRDGENIFDENHEGGADLRSTRSPGALRRCRARC